MADLLIVGTGAMALLFGSRLAASGVNVTLLGTWKEGIAAVNQAGIQVFRNGLSSQHQAAATSQLDQVQGVRLALVLVKSWQTERAAGQLARILDPEGVALTLQNGLGNREILSSRIGEERVAQGVTTCGATLLGPGQVRPGGEGLVSVQEHPRLAPLLDIFQQAEIDYQQVPDLSGLIWSKLVINVAINPLTALLGVRNGRLLESDSARIVMGLAAGEAAEVARAQGIQLAYQDPAQAAEGVAQATAGNLSSMLQDLNRGAPTEIDQLCGAVASLASSMDIPAPVNELVWRLIRARVALAGGSRYENS